MGTNENPTELVFTGSMDWYPNEDGILHFINYVLPLIRRKVPDASLTVVGRNPTNRIIAAASDAVVTVTGTVPDVRPYMSRSAVYVVPLRVGGGTRMKIFEAIAMGKAVVSTTVGAEGLPLIDGRHYLKADSPKHFAEAVLGLLEDPAKRKSLGDAGREHVVQHFSWPSS
jgi:glycosyltransferase involved in cell wall biosynthesis